jgi:hypothetical protein
MTDVSKLVVEVEAKGIKPTTEQLENLSEAGAKAEKNTGKVGKAAKSTVAPMKNMRAQAQQASYQLQDIAVQAQMGTNAFTIIGQQGSQLASVFGPSGAITGALIAFGAIIGGVLVNNLGLADTSVEDLETALGRLDTAMESTDNGAFELATRIKQLADVSTAAARAELLSLAVDSQIAFDNTGKAIGDSVNDAIDTHLFRLTNQIEKMRGKGLDGDDILALGAANVARVGMIGLQEALLELTSEFGLTTAQAVRFAEAAGGLKEGDYKSYKNFADVVDEIGVETNFADKELKTFRDGLTDQMVVMTQSVAKADLLKKSLAAIVDGDSEGLTSLTTGAAAAAEKEVTDAEALAKRIEAAKIKSFEQQSTAASAHVERLTLLGLTEEQKFAELQERELAKLKENLAAKLIAQTEYDAAVTALAGQASLRDDKADLKLEKEKASAQARLLQIEQSAMEEAELINSLEAEAIAKTQADRDAALISQKEFETAKDQIEEKHSKDRVALAQAEAQAKSDIQQQVLASMSGIAGQLSGIAEKGSKEAKVLFAMQKAIAIAQIIVATETAALTASAYVAGAGPIAWLASVTGIRAMGYASAGIVAGTAIAGGRALGGQVRGGESYLVGERGPELLTMGSSGRIATNENLKKAVGSESGQAQANVSVNFSIQANDTAGFDRLLNSRRGQIVSMINQAVNNRGRASIT